MLVMVQRAGEYRYNSEPTRLLIPLFKADKIIVVNTLGLRSLECPEKQKNLLEEL